MKIRGGNLMLEEPPLITPSSDRLLLQFQTIVSLFWMPTGREFHNVRVHALLREF